MEGLTEWCDNLERKPCTVSRTSPLRSDLIPIIICNEESSSDLEDNELANCEPLEEIPIVSPETCEKHKPKLKRILQYSEGQWSPRNLDGKRHYSRQFLISCQFHPCFFIKPEGILPSDVVKDTPNRSDYFVPSAPKDSGLAKKQWLGEQVDKTKTGTINSNDGDNSIIPSEDFVINIIEVLKVPNSLKCGICHEHMPTQDEGAIRCNICKISYHGECAGVSDVSIVQLFWRCLECRVKPLFDESTKMSEMVLQNNDLPANVSLVRAVSSTPKPLAAEPTASLGRVTKSPTTKPVATKCGVCKQPVPQEDQDSIDCCVCNQTFHVLCVGRGKQPKKAEKRVKTWKCPQCEPNACTLRTDITKLSESVKRIENKLKAVDKIQSDIQKLTKSVQVMSKKYDEILVKLNRVCEYNEKLEKKAETTQRQCKQILQTFAD